MKLWEVPPYVPILEFFSQGICGLPPTPQTTYCLAMFQYSTVLCCKWSIGALILYDLLKLMAIWSEVSTYYSAPHTEAPGSWISCEPLRMLAPSMHLNFSYQPLLTKGVATPSWQCSFSARFCCVCHCICQFCSLVYYTAYFKSSFYSNPIIATDVSSAAKAPS